MLIATFTIALLAKPQFVTKVTAQDYTEIEALWTAQTLLFPFLMIGMGCLFLFAEPYPTPQLMLEQLCTMQPSPNC